MVMISRKEKIRIYKSLINKCNKVNRRYHIPTQVTQVDMFNANIEKVRIYERKLIELERLEELENPMPLD
jgi:hypothetical protein